MGKVYEQVIYSRENLSSIVMYEQFLIVQYLGKIRFFLKWENYSEGKIKKEKGIFRRYIGKSYVVYRVYMF